MNGGGSAGPGAGVYNNDNNYTGRGDHNFGWIGIVGLAGLAGLMRRDRHRDVNNTSLRQ